MDKKDDLFSESQHIYKYACYVMLFLHLLYAAMFYFAGSTISSIYNVCATILYVFMMIRVRKNKVCKKCFIMCFLEMMLFSSIETLLCGYNSGFSFYFLCVISITMLFTYMVRETVTITTRYVVAEICYFLIVTCLSCFEVFGSVQLFAGWDKALYGTNMFFCAFFLLVFGLAFTKSVQKTEQALQKENRKLENAANYDPLTKLLNRRTFDHYFAEAVQGVINRGQDFTVMMVDIDDFKKVNDTYGHDAGDEVLKNVALILKCVVRPYDTVFRWGGEEIMLLLIADKKDTQIIAERCRERISHFVLQYDNQEIKTTITTGLCAYSALETKDSMIEKADSALYYGKQHGKNRVVTYSSHMSDV